MDKTLLRVNEAAAFLSVSRWTIYRWVEEGRLRGTKIGKGSLRIFHESLKGLVQDNQVDIAGELSRADRPTRTDRPRYCQCRL
ncbi:MAG: helix-turn-helix transcriptional regulator [Nitrospiraceae bacterium]